jgi:sialate O-acetylesterase
MVLQQQSEAPIWGKAKALSTIYIDCSWDDNKYITTADENGKWKIRVKTPKAGGPYTIKVNDQTIQNILIGEVWICSGQSNMQWSLNNTDNGEEEIKNANSSKIRLFYAARQLGDKPQDDCYGNWKECTPESAKSFSAVAYYYGKKLNKELNVPIGLIHTSWGGSTAQAWVKEEVLREDSEYDCYFETQKRKELEAVPGVVPITQHSPYRLYNAMIHPFIPYAMKGVIWYQGESNQSFCPNDPIRYEKLFPTLIESWRDEWQQGDFPFYYVQIAPFDWGITRVCAMVRDAQRKSLKVKNTGMAVTMDIGNPKDIHPRNKKDVGNRLALWALAKTYGQSDIVYSGPLYKSIKIEGKKARVSFDYVESGLMAKGGDLTHFEIAGENKVFYPATAVIDDGTVVVKSDKVKKPVAVRYAFYNTDEPNLFNKEGLPASSFRTDNWKIETKPVPKNKK